jgi:hypothetical protein
MRCEFTPAMNYLIHISRSHPVIMCHLVGNGFRDR